MTITVSKEKLLFPTKIIVSEDSDFMSYRHDLITWMIDYSHKHETNHRSNYGGYQSPDNFYLEESFTPLLNRISEHIVATKKEYCKDTVLEWDKLRLCNMWFNFNHKYCYNVTHTHPGCLLAGVLWIRIPDDVDPPPIKFEDPMAFVTSEIMDDTHINFTPVDGQMAMFPAHIPHRVDINDSDQTRISLSFNLVNH